MVPGSNFVIGVSKFKMAESICPLKIRRKLRLCSKLVYEVFDVAGHDLAIRRSKLKMVDAIRRLKI